jgi:RHS repeat-associated protein
MVSNRKALLCHYHYDPLDRLIDCAPFAQATTRRFYLNGRLATETQGTEQRSIMQHDDQLLAQQQRQGDTVEARLLATDRQRSVLSMLNANPPCPLAYTPYGHRPLGSGLLSLLGFNGERSDPVTGHYLLGNGYRAFNPVLMRFNCPDSWSPFGSGGLNAYAYCSGDAVNFQDPCGHSLLSALTTLASSAKPYFKTRRQANTWNLPNHLTPKNMSKELIESVNRNQPSTKRILVQTTR